MSASYNARADNRAKDSLPKSKKPADKADDPPTSIPVGKIAPPQISFEFTPKPLPADGKNSQNLTSLGNTELGYLYVQSDEKVAELWPDHIAKIRAAVKSIKK